MTTGASMTPAARTVTVDLGARSYDITIGQRLLPQIGEALAESVGKRAFIVSDSTVYDLHGDALRRGLAASGIEARSHVVAPGESSKSFSQLQALLDAMFEAGLSRNDAVIAFGGGVVGDLAGFASAVFKRGCKLVQVPTTLLAQVDSSVGGKTAINVAQGKNLVGAFYQPQRVIIDTDLLGTLAERELKAGYAEVLKYALIDDRAFFDWLQDNGQAVLTREPGALAYAIAHCCAAKARIVAADERERGQRALLNLGHTFAHALEHEAGFDGTLLHGEAVSAGLAMAFEFSHRSGLCSAEDAALVADHLRALDLVRPSTLGTLLGSPERLLAAMAHDKKNEGGQLTLILARGIGEAFIDRDADRDAVADYLDYLRLRHCS